MEMEKKFSWRFLEYRIRQFIFNILLFPKKYRIYFYAQLNQCLNYKCAPAGN